MHKSQIRSLIVRQTGTISKNDNKPVNVRYLGYIIREFHKYIQSSCWDWFECFDIPPFHTMFKSAGNHDLCVPLWGTGDAVAVKIEGAGLTGVGLLLCSNLKLRQSSIFFCFYSFLAVSFKYIFFSVFVAEAAQYESSYHGTATTPVVEPPESRLGRVKIMLQLSVFL